jgi:hypothetical protein
MMQADTATGSFVMLKTAERVLIEVSKTTDISARLPARAALESVRAAMDACRRAEPSLLTAWPG